CARDRTRPEARREPADPWRHSSGAPHAVARRRLRDGARSAYRWTTGVAQIPGGPATEDGVPSKPAAFPMGSLMDTADSTSPSSDEPQAPPRYTLWQLVRYMLRLGALGFGDPVALTGYMRRHLVDARGWIADSDYKEGLALAQLMPGPLAAQLAMYMGYVHYRIVGATLVGFAFVVPSFVMVVALGIAYVAYGGLGWMQAVFYGVGAAVIGIIAIGAWKLTTRSIGRDRFLWTIYVVAALTTVVTENEWVALFVAAGLVASLWRTPPRWMRSRGIGAAVA